VIKLRLKLYPKKNNPISLNYKYYLAAFCNNLISCCSDEFDEKLKKHNMKLNNKKVDLLSFTQFFCTDYEIKDTKIIFKDVINWYITSPVYELILHVVQELHNAGSIQIAKEEFEIISIEATELEDSILIDLNKDNYTLPLNKANDLTNRLEAYHMLLKDEMII
jgi:CRISPR/Cas system endoribonuclease Cas6 (RAMP superfamily)